MSQFSYKGQLKGHSGWVTCIATSSDSDVLISGGRDKNVIIWHLTHEQNNYGTPHKLLSGHSHYISDISFALGGTHCISSSWDKSLKLWNIKTGECVEKFVGHSKDVISLAVNKENKNVVSGSRDKSLKLWSIGGSDEGTITENGHSGWVSSVKFTPDSKFIVSGGWDKIVKIWNFSTKKLVTNLIGHTGYINSVAVSPDGSLCASGGKDQLAILWDLRKNVHLYSLEAGSEIHALAFSPKKYWLCAATSQSIRVWDLEKQKTIAELIPEYLKNENQKEEDKDKKKKQKKKRPTCISLAWSKDGATLFSGYTDNIIRVWTVSYSE